MKSIILALSLALVCISNATAATRYVSDQLEIQMRTGKGNEYRILRMLPSGTRLEVLETDKANGYSKVRLSGGIEGWVLSRFLMSERAAREQLADTEKKVARLELENRKLSGSLNEVQDARGSTEKQRSQLDKQNRKLSQELEEIRRAASSALAIDAENKELKSRIIAYERKAQSLEHENTGLKDRTARDWFMVGAGVVILGMVIGLIIPRIRWRKKSSWDTL